jgi:hypothetical protein
VAVGDRQLPRARAAERTLSALAIAEAAWRVVSATWFLGVVLFVITWPVQSLVPEGGLDFSFAAGLHMAAHEHLRFGTDVIGTYGPLGFLRYSFLYYTWTARFALLYTAAVHVLLCLSLIRALRRIVPVLTAFLLAWIGVSIIIGEPESALVVVLVWLVEYLRSDAPGWLVRAFPAAAGVVSGVEVLVKINTGATIALLAAIGVLVRGRQNWRAVAVFAGSFAAAFLVSWFATGQELGNIGDYVSTARQLVQGWSSAMQYPGPNYQIWAALVAALAVLVAAWQAMVDEPPGRRAAMLLVILLLGFSVFKEGFVGQSAGHELIYFGTAIGVLVAFAWRPSQRSTMLWALTLLVALTYAATQADPGELLEPGARASALADQIETMSSAGKRDALVAKARRTLGVAYQLDDETLRQLAGHTVTVVPSEQTIVWVNKLDWKPVPVYQLYYAVTPALDELNARTFASPRGPERVLQSLSPPVNDRNKLFDSPAAQRAMLCHYTALWTTPKYQVLGRVPDRCGAPRLTATVRARWQQFVTVPAPPARDELVYVRVSGAAPQGLESLRALFWRSYARVIALRQNATEAPRDYTTVPDTLADGLTIYVPPAADFPGVFALNPHATQLALAISSESRAPDLTYRFYSQKIAPAPAG